MHAGPHRDRAPQAVAASAPTRDVSLTPCRLRSLARLLRAGGVIAYPTEAVFGLGCDPRNESAVRRILAIKQRPVTKGLILIAADFEQLKPWLLPLAPEHWAEVSRSWPGPVSWLLPARPETPGWLRGKHNTLATRVTAHPIAAALCRAAGFPLVSTSANRSGQPSLRTALAVQRQLGREVDAVVTEPVGPAHRPSTIRTLDGRIVRAG